MKFDRNGLYLLGVRVTTPKRLLILTGQFTETRYAYWDRHYNVFYFAGLAFVWRKEL